MSAYLYPLGTLVLVGALTTGLTYLARKKTTTGEEIRSWPIFLGIGFWLFLLIWRYMDWTATAIFSTMVAAFIFTLTGIFLFFTEGYSYCVDLGQPDGSDKYNGPLLFLLFLAIMAILIHDSGKCISSLIEIIKGGTVLALSVLLLLLNMNMIKSDVLHTFFYILNFISFYLFLNKYYTIFTRPCK